MYEAESASYYGGFCLPVKRHLRKELTPYSVKYKNTDIIGVLCDFKSSYPKSMTEKLPLLPASNEGIK